MPHFEPRIQMTFWCKWRITKTSECAEMLSRAVTFGLREQYCGYSRSNSLPCEIFLPSDWEFFWGNWGKKKDILDWEWGLISDPGDREKRPCTEGILKDLQTTKSIKKITQHAKNNLTCTATQCGQVCSIWSEPLDILHLSTFCN